MSITYIKFTSLLTYYSFIQRSKILHCNFHPPRWSSSVCVVECAYCLWNKWVPIPTCPVMWLSQSSATIYMDKLYCQRVGCVIVNFLSFYSQSSQVFFVKVSLSLPRHLSCLPCDFVQSWSVPVSHTPSPTHHSKQKHTAYCRTIERGQYLVVYMEGS